MCEAYQPGPTVHQINSGHHSPLPMPDSLRQSSTTRLSQLGMSLLVDAAQEDKRRSGMIVWQSTLPRVCSISSTAFAASAALGAAYEAFTASSAHWLRSQSEANSHYQIALDLLQKDLLLPGRDPVSCLLGSLILAGVEVLQRNLTNALAHIQGAFN